MSSPTRRLSSALLCCPVLDDRNGRPATQVFEHVISNGIRQLQVRPTGQDSQLPRRIALTRRMSAVRARQHRPVKLLFGLQFLTGGFFGVAVRVLRK